MPATRATLPRMATDWNIRPRDERCADCETPFEDGQVCHSVLRFDDEGYSRDDCCEACWTRDRARDGVVSTWRGVFHRPPPPAPDPVNRATAEGLLRKLMEDRAETHANVIYILAVMLERKRMLVERASTTHPDGTLVRFYEHRRSGEAFSIRDPRLSLDELEPIQQEVITMLESLNPAPPEPASAPDAATPVVQPAETAQTAQTGPADDSGLRAGFYQRNA